MSTVLPPAAALPLLVALPLLLLPLLQPTAANAIAVRAAMAVVRLMIFLSFFEVVRLPQNALTGLVCACGLAASGRGRSDEVTYGGGTVQGSIPARIPGRANVAVGTSVGDFPPGAEQTGSAVGPRRSSQICQH